MANVQLPSIAHTNTDIDGASLSGLQNIVKSLMNTTAILTEELTYLLNNLDTRNVNELNAKVITARSIVADKIAAGAITAEKIEANAVTAEKIKAGAITSEKIDVDELSAISANLGHITAGLIEAINIFGSYIATSQSYPRCEMSSTGNVFGAFSSDQHYIAIDPAYAGTPALKFFYAGLEFGRINNMSGVMDIVGTAGIDLYTGNENLKIPSFGKVVSASGQNLGVELDSKASTDRSTGWSGDHNHGIPNGTVLQKADGGTVIWSVAPQHTHEQLA